MTDINQMSTKTINQYFQVPQGIAGLKILKACLVTSQIKENKYCIQLCFSEDK